MTTAQPTATRGAAPASWGARAAARGSRRAPSVRLDRMQSGWDQVTTLSGVISG